MPQSIDSFIAEHRASTPGADIVSRWEDRIAAQGLDIQGRSGALAYASRYLKGAKAPKVIAFARLAELKNRQEFANALWEEAYLLAYGVHASVHGSSPAVPIAAAPTAAIRTAFRQKPQLPVMIDEPELARFINDDRYGFQEKHDGEHALIDVGAESSCGNKSGLSRPVPIQTTSHLGKLGRVLIDGEEVRGDAYYVFDLLENDGEDLRLHPYILRYQQLQNLMQFAAIEGAIVLSPLATTTREKRALLDQLRAAGREGVVIKDLTAPYVPGKGHGTQFKFQFRARAAVIAGNQPKADVQSVEMFVLRPDGSPRHVGNVKVKQNFPRPGTVLEVKYLYCSPGPTGKLLQAEFITERFDTTAADCLESKLRVKNLAA